MTKPLLIGQLAKLAGVKPDSVRFYERSGLLPRAERTQAGYRVYDDAALKRLRFIKQAQSLGFSLDEIKRVLSLRGQGKETCQAVIAVAEATLAETQYKLRQLQHFRDQLQRHVAKWKRTAACPGNICGEFCNLIEQTAFEPAPSDRPDMARKHPAGRK